MLNQNLTDTNIGTQSYLRNFLTIVFKRKYMIVSIFSIIVIFTLLFSFLIPPTYEVDATVLIEREMDSEKALLFRMDLTPSYQEYNWITSEMEIIKSFPIAEKVLLQMNLDHSENQKKSLNAKLKEEPFEREVKKLMSNLDVTNPKKTNIINFSFKGEDPEYIYNTLNNYLETYITYRSELANESGTYDFFENQINIADKKLQELEKKQTKFKQENQLISPESHQQILLNKLTDFEKKLTEVRTKIIGKKAILSVISEQMKSGKKLSIPKTETSDSPSREKYIGDLKGKLLDLEIQKEALLQIYTPKYEEVVNLEKQIEATKAKLYNEIAQIIEMEETGIRALEAEESALQSSINQITMEIRNFAEKEYEYNQISRGLEDSHEIYSLLLKQREESGISLAKLDKGVKITIINKAFIPTDPVLPNKKLNLALAVFLGLFAGLSLAFFLEFFDHRINTSEELEKYTGLTNWGFVRDLKI
jgi:polysaccharide biosynthesis transport protein